MKAVGLMIAVAFAAGALTTPTFAAAQSADLQNGVNAELFAFCSSLQEKFPDLVLGRCTSYNLTQGTYGFVPHICDELLGRGLLDDFGFDSFDDCVRNAR